ncbi:MAG TPA: beta-propeller fold lactonase family protein [Candidatus Limnocylindrales bacterium]|nr:beta-propeller fold lactonase family protein [Candidatus Limnocylindrales bacterium]
MTGMTGSASMRLLSWAVLLLCGCHAAPAGPLVFVTNERDGTVSVIDAATDRVAETLDVGSRPRGVGLAADGRSFCIALSKTATARTGSEEILCLDARSFRPVAHYPAGTDPECFALGRDGRRLYVANEDAGTASIMDLATGRAVTRWIGLEPEGVTVSPDGRWVYVTSESSSTVSVIDTTSDEVVKSFLVGARPRESAFSPDGAFAFVSAENGASVSIVDTRTHSVVDTIALDGADSQAQGVLVRPKGVACSPDGKRLYVATGRGNSVAVVDLDARRVRSQIAVGQRPWGIALTRDGSKLYTANGLSNDVSVIDTKNETVVATIKAGDGPWGIVVAE